MARQDPPTRPGDAPAMPPSTGDSASEAAALRLELAGFEGPIDLLLTLAREQKVDLAKISILALANQYLAYIARAKRLNLELAAGYLVTAAWLTWMKSRLLLPEQPEDGGETAEDPTLQAALLALRLQRLEAMRNAVAQLTARPQQGRDFFARGEDQPHALRERTVPVATLYDMLAAYGSIQRRREDIPLHIALPRLHTVEAARRRLSRLLGQTPDWRQLDSFLPDPPEAEPLLLRSTVASYFAATLELAKEGAALMQQQENFAPLYLKASPRTGEPE